ncbi:magnesium transporter CorA family protein [Deinococcus actinosclerus]|uniref:Magnesium transporter n=1 Tax=Deinococcus actinosclerus TaxID=1768108 RepID=A0ABM5X1H8_9DEIO|nr:CorA family divalent cation transporter [Deinococcus actinosclerus]ALW87554.1 hypothetical protein AUC44_00450 [Deinococcus actinosclerus]
MPTRILLFDAAGQDCAVEPGALPGTLTRLGPHQLLWVDVQADAAEDRREQLAALDLDAPTRAWLDTTDPHPALHRHEQAVHLRVNSLEKGAHHYHASPVAFVAGRNVVYTAHDGPARFLDSFRGRLEGDTNLGQLDAAAFLAVVLAHHVEGFVQPLSPIEDNIDRLDELILQEPRHGRRHLETLVGLRRRVSELRRLLTAHRPVYVALASPDFTVFDHDEPEVRLEKLLRAFEHTQEAVSHTREAVLGTFDLLMSSTGQRTNEVMRVLTVVTVTLGIVAAVAGLMGMNFQADIFKAGNTGFRDVLLGSGLLIVLIVALGRWRGWL